MTKTPHHSPAATDSPQGVVVIIGIIPEVRP
jgi:hypothetical protein